jgi:predicted ATP-dependent endonuclease of OLD family
MRLVQTQTTKYKSIDDSTAYSIEPDITCLVGKNESGKSALLESLYRLKPLSMGLISGFDGLRDYPRRTFATDEPKVATTTVISATYELTSEEVHAFNEEFGDALTSRLVNFTKKYSNAHGVGVQLNNPALLAHVKALPELAGLPVSKLQTLDAVNAAIDAVKDPSIALTKLRERLSTNLAQQARVWLLNRLPQNLLFTQYSTMAGTVSIERLQTVNEDELQPQERTALSLLRLAGVESEQFDEANYEARKARLEAAANALTDEVFEFWSQNEDLQVELDIDFVPKQNQPTVREPFLKIRIRNNQHRVTLDFSERSVGFVWFFSFLAFFSEYRNSTEPLVLLLDEPGLNLHAAAQADLLRFIEVRLAADHQVIYSTHSPFMIQPQHLERVRLVEDRKGEGTRIREDALGSQEETQFPIHAAIGIRAAQTLFIGENTLIVEGPADLMYFQALSSHLESLGRTGLDPAWVVTPVGGLEKIPTFIALLSQQLNVAAVHDSDGRGVKRLVDLVERKIISKNKVIDLLKFARSNKAADLEDLFEPEWYLMLLGECRIAEIEIAEMKSKENRIVLRIEHHLGHKYSHYIPAGHLKRHPELLATIGEDALARFERLFDTLNKLVVTT